ncbi:hypothetical protein C443_02539 [Haloarcula argentinensis DSM 12282]|nr:hypothetical protein C443_02539 [Haloarcula argentinensis DSM 12282]
MFFEEQINKMDAFGPDLYGFLEDDYQNGPGAWQKVYLSNLKIQKELFDIYQMAPGTILDEETITKLIDACHGPISDLELSARRVEGINEDATRNMSQYLNTFRDLLIGMRTYDDIVRYSQSQLFEEIVKTYHGCVWTWVSSIASTQTVDEDKERADSLKEDNAQFVQENKSYWTGRVEDLQGSLEDTGLKPSNSDYQNELDPKTKQLMEPIESTFLS